MLHQCTADDGSLVARHRSCCICAFLATWGCGDALSATWRVAVEWFGTCHSQPSHRLAVDCDLVTLLQRAMSWPAPAMLCPAVAMFLHGAAVMFRVAAAMLLASPASVGGHLTPPRAAEFERVLHALSSMSVVNRRVAAFA